MSREPTYTLLYDTDLGKPGCVLLQAIAGDPGALRQFFPAGEWLTAPTPGMVRLTGTAAQWRRVAGLKRNAVAPKDSARPRAVRHARAGRRARPKVGRPESGGGA